MSQPPTHTLTAANVADLRASLRTRTSGVDTSGVACITHGAADALFYLIIRGKVMCAHPDPRVLGAMLVAERAEPGFAATVLDSTHPVDEALLDPAGRLRARSLANAEANTRATAAREAEERRHNLMRNVDPASVTLDDIL